MTVSAFSPATECVFTGHQIAMSVVKSSKASSTGRRTTTDFLITASLVCWLIGLSFLCGFLEGRERVLPEALEVLAQLGERVAVDAVIVARALSAVADEARLLEHAEVLRDRGARDVRPRASSTTGCGPRRSRSNT